MSIAVGALVAEFTLLEAHDLRTEKILEKKQQETAQKMENLEDDYRKIMKQMGFNLLILPKDQNLSDLYSEGYASRTMPEEAVQKLSQSKIMTVRHLLPSLEQKVRWKEQGNRLIILNGIKGEIPFSHRTPKKPILIAVPPGKMAVGFELWKSLELEPGDKVTLLGREFEVSSLHEQRGNKDDITAWIDLDVAQELLNKEDRINAILALKCHCTGADIEKVRSDILGILPDTQIVELQNKALARARARDRAAVAARAALEAERENRARIRSEIENFAAWILPVVIIGCTAWIGLLTYANVRDRRREIAILGAIGLRPGQILTVFLIKGMIIGFLGGVFGYAGGYIIGILSGNATIEIETGKAVFNVLILAGSLIGAPLLCLVASLAPAMLACGQNPADIFSRE